MPLKLTLVTLLLFMVACNFSGSSSKDMTGEAPMGYFVNGKPKLLTLENGMTREEFIHDMLTSSLLKQIGSEELAGLRGFITDEEFQSLPADVQGLFEQALTLQAVSGSSQVDTAYEYIRWLSQIMPPEEINDILEADEDLRRFLAEALSRKELHSRPRLIQNALVKDYGNHYAEYTKNSFGIITIFWIWVVSFSKPLECIKRLAVAAKPLVPLGRSTLELSGKKHASITITKKV